MDDDFGPTTLQYRISGTAAGQENLPQSSILTSTFQRPLLTSS